MKLSVVSTLYKSRIFLDIFVKEILESIDELKIKDFELVFVNDGSLDDSMSFLLQKKKEIPEITVIDLSRNFGHHYAIQAGLQYAKGVMTRPVWELLNRLPVYRDCPSGDLSVSGRLADTLVNITSSVRI
jgi:glycosyltransferase involved in cell wall biosynthesis